MDHWKALVGLSLQVAVLLLFVLIAWRSIKGRQ